MLDPIAPASSSAFRQMDALDALCASLVAAIAAWSWLALTLAEAALFTPLWAVVVAGAVSVACGAFVWRRLRPIARVAIAPAIACAAVIAAAGWLASRPAEYLVDGGDASVYLNIGHAVARHGALQFPDRILDAIPPERWDALIERERHPPRVFNLFPGGIQVEPGVNAVQPNFFHLFPVWVAIAETIAGPRAGYFVSPAFGVLTAAAIWLLARLLTSTLVATLTATLLLANVGQQWFSRVSTTEVMTEALVVSGALFSVWAYRGGPAITAALAGTTFGLAAFVRIDVLMLVAPIVVGFLLLVLAEGRWGRRWTWYAVALAGVSTHAAAHAWLVSTLYTRRIIFYALQGRGVSTASRVVPPVVLASAAGAYLVARRLSARGLAGSARRLPWLVFGVVCLAAAYRIWPQVTGGPLATLLTPWGMAAAMAGLGLWVYRERSAIAVLIAGLLLISMMVYGESVREGAGMPMPLRRFVPVVLPLATLGIGLLLDWLWRIRAVGRVASIAVWAAIIALWGADSRAVARTRPMQDVHDQVARLAAALPADAIVVADRSTPSHLALSLWSTFGRDVLFARPTPDTASALGALARESGRPMVIMRGNGAGALTALHLAELSLSDPRTETLVLTPLEPATSRFPRALTRYEVPIEFYGAAPRLAPSAIALVEIGAGDLGAVLDGFHAPEQMGPASARWTEAEARVLLPALPAVSAAALTMRVAAPRAAGTPAPPIRVLVNDIEAGDAPVATAAFAEIRVSLSPRVVATMVGRTSILRLRVPTFVPAAHGMGADTRQLGVVVDWIRVDGQ